jgi:hypothetical protein
MKRHLAPVALLLGVVLAAGLLMSTTSSAGIADTARDNPLRGTWIVTVQLGAPPGQQAPPPFESTIAYTAGGSVVEQTSRHGLDAGGLGVWERTGPSTYVSKIQKYRFDSSGVYLGKVVITETIEVTSRSSYRTTSSVSDIYNAAGTLVAHLDNATVTAVRMQVS